MLFLWPVYDGEKIRHRTAVIKNFRHSYSVQKKIVFYEEKFKKIIYINESAQKVHSSNPKKSTVRSYQKHWKFPLIFHQSRSDQSIYLEHDHK